MLVLFKHSIRLQFTVSSVFIMFISFKKKTDIDLEFLCKKKNSTPIEILPFKYKVLALFNFNKLLYPFRVFFLNNIFYRLKFSDLCWSLLFYKKGRFYRHLRLVKNIITITKPALHISNGATFQTS